MSVVRVHVLVWEVDRDDREIEVGRFDIGYFQGQEYTVAIITPDGTDKEISHQAGDAS